MAPPLRDPVEVKGLRDIRPDVYYPLIVYCRLLFVSPETAYKHARDGIVKTLQIKEVPRRKSVAKTGRRVGGPRHKVLGAEILRVAAVDILAIPQAEETKAERRSRVLGAVERLKSLGVKIPEPVS